MEVVEHHAHVQIFLLGIELILEVIFPFVNMYIDNYLLVRDAKKKNLPIPTGPISLDIEEDENVDILKEELESVKKKLEEAKQKINELTNKEE